MISIRNKSGWFEGCCFGCIAPVDMSWFLVVAAGIEIGHGFESGQRVWDLVLVCGTKIKRIFFLTDLPKDQLPTTKPAAPTNDYNFGIFRICNKLRILVNLITLITPVYYRSNTLLPYEFARSFAK